MQLQGIKGLLTGAAGGLGQEMARGLAGQGVALVLSGRDEAALNALRDSLPGSVHLVITADLSSRDEAKALIPLVEAEAGPLDLLVNNAGIETGGTYHRLEVSDIERMVDLNLLAPMLLTHAVIPGMLERGKGHVVQIASVAGLASVACSEPYSATKGGLVRFNESLRATYDKDPVGFSVVCPGFTEGGGMYTRMEAEGHKSNPMLGTSTIEDVSAKVVKAITGDKPLLISNNRPLRPILAMGALSPGLSSILMERSGANQIFRDVAADREK
ncbi:MAG: SDR family NAD(P)-dependent oxidoreductase [Solirubrobacterales bacterium]|nr:SDR family NAD(P)-dependent oxidoreductase [Solirubrobacterales bacterium]